ncbi:MAG: pseudouridine synthase [Myxococcota bacterium]
MSDGPRVLHHDAHVLVMHKPSGLAVHPGWVPRTERTAMHWARREAKQHVYPVHRLDRATSGVLVFALSSEVARTLGQHFSGGTVQKRYVALVRGTPDEHGQIDHPVPKSEGGERVPAQTDYRRLRRSDADRCSLVEARPKTGRLHQIRRHLKHLSHPLVGDVRYGKGDINRRYRTTWGLHRLALHALQLSMPHPRWDGTLDVWAPVPADLAEPLERLGLLSAVPEQPDAQAPNI